MFSFQEKKIQKHKKLFEETEQTTETHMEGMLELSEWVFKTTMINMLRALKDKVDNMQEHMGNVSREIEILREKNKF